jgi:SRSO17 transposase
VDRFVRHFHVYHSDASFRARQYLQGLMQADRKNMERMGDVVPKADSQALQQFLSDSPWDAQDVMDEVALRASELIGDPEEACLILDETSFRKKGKKSAGVERQYLGCVGKVDNGQVGVFSSLCRDNRVTLLHGRLYLPQSWCSDKARCAAAKIPVEERDFRTKDSLALSQVRRARGLGVKFGWVLADAGYGKGPDFLLKLDGLGERFLVDVHKNFVVYRGHPRPRIPRRSSPRGRAPTRARTKAAPVEVQELVARQGEGAWKRRTLRQGTQEEVTYACLRMPVWIWEKDTKSTLLCQLIARKDPNGEIKYSLSNAKRGVSLLQLAKVQGQRYWIERSFQDGKMACGMKDYQVQGWVGWHHHMALVMMAMLFMLEQRLATQKENPTLTCKDIEYLLAKALPRKDMTFEDALELVRTRCKRREALYAKSAVGSYANSA